MVPSINGATPGKATKYVSVDGVLVPVPKKKKMPRPKAWGYGKWRCLNCGVFSYLDYKCIGCGKDRTHSVLINWGDIDKDGQPSRLRPTEEIYHDGLIRDRYTDTNEFELVPLGNIGVTRRQSGAWGRSTPRVRNVKNVSTPTKRQAICQQYNYQYGCIVPGCSTPAIMHHFVARRNNGGNEVSNLVSICEWHEDMVHLAGFVAMLFERDGQLPKWMEARLRKLPNFRPEWLVHGQIASGIPEEGHDEDEMAREHAEFDRLMAERYAKNKFKKNSTNLAAPAIERLRKSKYMLEP